MSEKYSKIFSLPENLYAHGAPVVIKAGALLKDNESNRLIGQLKLHSISNKKIKLVKIELTCFDSLGRQLDSPIVSEYLDLIVNRGVDFGAKTPINIANPSTRSYTVKVIEVGFDDNTVWFDNSNVWEPIPKQAPITSILKNHNEVQGYKAIFGTGASMAVCEYNDLWLCTCGEINHSYETRCNKCNSSFADLKNIDVSVLATESIYSTACNMAKSDDIETLQDAIQKFGGIIDYKDSQTLAEECQIRVLSLQNVDNTKKAKRNKLTKIVSLIASGLLFLGIFGYFIIYPFVSSSVGNYSVYIKMYNVKDFTVPHGVTSINEAAFRGCDKLKNVAIPDSVTSIGDFAFQYCSSLNNIEIPDSVTTIGDLTFAYCDNLSSIVIPDSVTNIGSNAFFGCDLITSIVIPNSMASISKDTFAYCHSLTSVTIENGVKTIDAFAFSYCESLASVTIGKSVTSIGNYAFNSCTSLTQIRFEGTVEQWNAISLGACWNDNVPATEIICSDGTVSLK